MDSQEDVHLCLKNSEPVFTFFDAAPPCFAAPTFKEMIELHTTTTTTTTHLIYIYIYNLRLTLYPTYIYMYNTHIFMFTIYISISPLFSNSSNPINHIHYIASSTSKFQETQIKVDIPDCFGFHPVASFVVAYSNTLIHGSLLKTHFF